MGKISQLTFPIIGIPISPNVVPIGTPLCGILSDSLQRIFLSVLSVSNDPDKSGLKLMKKLRYSIYIYFFFGSLCLGG